MMGYKCSISNNKYKQMRTMTGEKKKSSIRLHLEAILFQSSCVGVSFLKRMRFTQQYQYCDSIYRTLNKLNMVLVKMHTNAFHT